VIKPWQIPLNHRFRLEAAKRGSKHLAVSELGQKMESQRRGATNCQVLRPISNRLWQFRQWQAVFHLTTDNNIVFASDSNRKTKKRHSFTTSLRSALKVTGAIIPI